MELKLDFQVEYVNFNLNKDSGSVMGHSTEIFGDEQRIMQVLLGLQSNAIKFTQKGFVKIKVEIISNTGNQNRYLQISVIDSGIGIEEKDHDKLFKLFGFISSS